MDVPCKGGAAGKARPAFLATSRAVLPHLSISGPASCPITGFSTTRRQGYSVVQVTIRELLPWMRDHLLAERPELFMKDDSVCVGLQSSLACLIHSRP